jgi:hypothetical protein
MDTLDHMETASWGSRASAVAYRTDQTDALKAGNYDAAVQMDIANIKELFPGKYDAAIQQAQAAWDAIKGSFANLDQFCNPKPPGDPPLPPFPQPSGVPSAELPVLEPDEGGTAPADAYAVSADVTEYDNTYSGGSSDTVVITAPADASLEITADTSSDTGTYSFLTNCTAGSSCTLSFWEAEGDGASINLVVYAKATATSPIQAVDAESFGLYGAAHYCG